MSPAAPPELLSASRERWLLWTLAAVQFTHIMDFMVMMPLGPQLRTAFGITDAQFGLLVSAYTFAAGLTGLGSALFIDRFGRKQLLLGLYALFAVATQACALAPSYESLLIARVFAGLFGGVLSALCQTIVAEVVPFERRGRAMGILMSAFSVSTVAGVPMGLWLASTFDWHAPFLFLAIASALIAGAAAASMPSLRKHLATAKSHSSVDNIRAVLADRGHWRAFLFSSVMFVGGFSVIPFITLYLTANVGLTMNQVPWIYLAGGAATLISARVIGRAADRYGKRRVFKMLAATACVPIFALTVLPKIDLMWVLVVSTVMFVFLSGRMIPATALLSSAANPALRGTFMSLNSAVQSGTMGLAAYLGGLFIGRDAAGAITGYWINGGFAVATGLVSIALANWLILREPDVPKRT
jgi:predicted MFS family arabinose efflux permease